MGAIDTFKIKISKDGYKEKPCADDIKNITWHMKSSDNKCVSYKELAGILESGHSVLLAEFKEKGNIREDNIISLSCIALDIDSKENEITMYEMISKINSTLSIYPILYYCTFSDKDFTKFRLIYRLENKIDVETYRMLYLAFQWKFKKYLDHATKNANRIWAGTNKSVFYNENDVPITFEKLLKLIRAYEASEKRKAKKKNVIEKEKYKDISFNNEDYIKPEYKEQVINYLIEHIDLTDFIPKHFGGRYKKYGDRLTGACVLHGGDNNTALVINKDRYTCFTHCGCGNIITVARKAYNIENFSSVAFKLMEEYGLGIPDHYIRRVKHGGNSDLTGR